MISGSLAVTAVGIWATGKAIGSSLLSYVGFMSGACTFLPLPADAWVLHAATANTPLTVGLIGGLVNAVIVLIERLWVLRFVDHPSFDRFKRFVGTNRYVDWTERHLFIGLVVGGFSFIPFEPFRLVAVLRDYTPSRYALATFVGRGFRYYWLARAGSIFAGLGVVKYAVWMSLAFFAVGLYRSYRTFKADGETSPQA